MGHTRTDKIDRPQSATGTGFERFGMEHMAYIKTVHIDGQRMHAVHAADGTPLTVVSDRNLAFATVSQHDMRPLSVH